MEDGQPDTTPPLVALHRITANVLEVKGAWAFALGLPADPDSEAAAVHQDIGRRCICVLGAAQADRLIDETADLHWVRRVYYALLGESLQGNPDDAGIDTDTLAARIIDCCTAPDRAPEHGCGRDAIVRQTVPRRRDPALEAGLQPIAERPPLQRTHGPGHGRPSDDSAPRRSGSCTLHGVPLPGRAIRVR
ncbi:hypothetical protein LV779_13985 [Streptomyces thinghirensis]|nr:hypothetical protein [Streptomyces thinghirensis]